MWRRAPGQTTRCPSPTPRLTTGHGRSHPRGPGPVPVSGAGRGRVYARLSSCPHTLSPPEVKQLSRERVSPVEVNFPRSVGPRHARVGPLVRARREVPSLERRRARSLLVALLVGFALLGVGVDDAFQQPVAALRVIGFAAGVITIATGVLISGPPVLAVGLPRRAAGPLPLSPGHGRRSGWGPPSLAMGPPPPPPSRLSRRGDHRRGYRGPEAQPARRCRQPLGGPDLVVIGWGPAFAGDSRSRSAPPGSDDRVRCVPSTIAIVAALARARTTARGRGPGRAGTP